MTQKKKTIYSVALLLLVGLGFLFTLTKDSDFHLFSEYMRYEKGTVSVYGKEIEVYLADDPRIRTRGLSNKTYLPEDKGMLFVFEKPDQYSFWMKDMNFSIDMIWIDEFGKIVYVRENVPPESYPTLFTPSKSALYVLELNAGKAREIGLTVGTEVDIEL
jgi:uncharacterized membrane protein (UPF0127 family)